jgi:hypothetical protein
MIRLITLALVAAATPALAQPLAVPVGETWLFTLDHGEPVHARRADRSAKPARDEIKVTVRALLGTMMTISNNSPKGYIFKAELVGADGKRIAGRTCTLPPGNQPALESWPTKAASVRIFDFRLAAGGRC